MAHKVTVPPALLVGVAVGIDVPSVNAKVAGVYETEGVGGMCLSTTLDGIIPAQYALAFRTRTTSEGLSVSGTP